MTVIRGAPQRKPGFPTKTLMCHPIWNFSNEDLNKAFDIRSQGGLSTSLLSISWCAWHACVMVALGPRAAGSFDSSARLSQCLLSRPMGRHHACGAKRHVLKFGPPNSLSPTPCASRSVYHEQQAIDDCGGALEN